MTINDILLLPVTDQVTLLQKRNTDLPDYNTLHNEYYPEHHAVFDAALRPNKTVKRAKTDGQDAYGNETYTTEYEAVNRIAAPFQQLIVERAVGFLMGNPVTVDSDADNDTRQLLTDMVERILKDNKSEYFNRRLARTVMSECEAAELWYFVEDPAFWKKTITGSENNKFKLRVKLLSPGAGDKMFPLFDETGNMIAFSRVYEITEIDGKTITDHFDTWTDLYNVSRVQLNGEWQQTITPNPIQKIPVIYYSQPQPEWYAVQSVIERYETKASNFADTNDYFGSPMVKVIGEVTSLPGKTTSGKVIQMTQGSDANYMSWDSAPESEKLEFELLEKLIYSMTQTPNISFEQMKSMGGDLSGFAIKLMFTDAHLKVQNKIELFGEMFTRRLNLLKAACGNVINVALQGEVPYVTLEPVFSAFLPKNVKEEVEILSTARAGKPLISQETAIEQNPLAVAGTDVELERMATDSAADTAAMQNEFNGSFNLQQ